jgi:hypothetical protein
VGIGFDLSFYQILEMQHGAVEDNSQPIPMGLGHLPAKTHFSCQVSHLSMRYSILSVFPIAKLAYRVFLPATFDISKSGSVPPNLVCFKTCH